MTPPNFFDQIKLFSTEIATKPNQVMLSFKLERQKVYFASYQIMFLTAYVNG